jgi:hypothetical protein
MQHSQRFVSPVPYSCDETDRLTDHYHGNSDVIAMKIDQIRTLVGGKIVAWK